MIKKEKPQHSETISNLFLMSKLVYRMIFDQFGTFSTFGLFFIKGADDQKEKSDHSETISNRFLMFKLVCRMIFDRFGTFSIFGLFFIKVSDDQQREVGPF